MTQAPRKIAFIGAGNMTHGIVGGMVSNGYPGHAHHTSNPSAAKRDHLQARRHEQRSHDNAEVANVAEVIVLGAKPQLMAEVCQDLQARVPHLQDKTIVTIAAGIRLEKYADYLGDSARVVRVMPNTPS